MSFEQQFLAAKADADARPSSPGPAHRMALSLEGLGQEEAAYSIHCKSVGLCGPGHNSK